MTPLRIQEVTRAIDPTPVHEVNSRTDRVRNDYGTMVTQ